MKGLFLKQPYAYAVFNGKSIENRSWSTNYRGELVIGASKLDKKYLKEGKEFCQNAGLEIPNELTFGHLIGVVDLIEVVRSEERLGRWGLPGQYHWYLERPRRFINPISYRGMPGLITLTPKAIGEIKQLEEFDCCNFDNSNKELPDRFNHPRAYLALDEPGVEEKIKAKYKWETGLEPSQVRCLADIPF